jgi:hypothetical protein
MTETHWWSLGCYHGHSGKSAPAHRWCRARTIGGSGCRRDIAGGTPAAQQPSFHAPLQHLARQVGGLGVYLKVRLLLLRVVVPMMMWRLHSLRLEVAVVQQQLHLLRTPMQVHSHRRVRAPAAAQPQRNEQALSVERLYKFYPSGDMSGSVPVYVTQGFHTVN